MEPAAPFARGPFAVASQARRHGLCFGTARRALPDPRRPLSVGRPAGLALPDKRTRGGALASSLEVTVMSTLIGQASVGQAILSSIREQINLPEYQKIHWEGSFE